MNERRGLKRYQEEVPNPIKKKKKNSFFLSPKFTFVISDDFASAVYQTQLESKVSDFANTCITWTLLGVGESG